MNHIRKRSSETKLVGRLYESYVPGKQVRVGLQSFAAIPGKVFPARENMIN